MDIIKTLGPLDYGFLVVLGLSLLLGAVKGFVHVAMSLAGWFVALMAAHFFADWLSPYLAATGLGETPRYALAFIVLFIIALVTWSLVTMMVKQAVNRIGFASLDHLLGAGLGLVRGAVIVISLTVVVSLTPADQSTTWQSSAAVKMAKTAAAASKPFLPAKFAALVPSP
jgi:membrane protein required for colicin V production